MGAAMKKIALILAVFLALPAWAQSGEKQTPAPEQPTGKNAATSARKMPGNVPEIDCYIDKETQRMVCKNAIAAYRSLYGKCCHFNFQTKTTYCH